jgi:hypothetical protein
MVSKSKIFILTIALVTIFQLGFAAPAFAASNVIPVSGAPALTAVEEKSAFISLDEFSQGVADGAAKTIRGVYVQDVMALRVVQQPAGEPAFVSATAGTVTQFGMASASGTTGLLAHNFAAGKLFSNLTQGQVVNVVYGDGTMKNYEIKKVLRFQALQPSSPTSNFVNIDTQEQLTASGLFSQVYTGSHHLTFQTCIQQGSEDSWGRLFILADPLN